MIRCTHLMTAFATFLLLNSGSFALGGGTHHISGDDIKGVVLVPQPEGFLVTAVIWGEASGIGEFIGVGHHFWVWVDDSAFGEVGQLTLANTAGDLLVGQYQLLFPLRFGRTQAPPFLGEGSIKFIGGTGRFDGAIGSASIRAVDPNTGSFHVAIRGTVSTP